MDLVQLSYFEAIARGGSFTKAARQLGVSQPTLTVAIQNLERSLGTRLFHRDRQGARLTDAGHELLGQAVHIFAVVDAAEQRLQSLQNEDVGRFTIGCHGSLGAYFLPDFMAAFLAEAPRIELSLWNNRSAAVWEGVLARDVHFGLIVNSLPHPDLVLTRLYRDAVDIMAPAESATGPGGRPSRGPTAPPSKTPTLADAQARLKAGPLIYAEHFPASEELIRRLSGEGLMPNRVLVCGDLEQVKSLALAGIGVALLPRRVAAYGQAGRLQRLHPALPFSPDIIYLVYRGDLHRTKAALRVKDALVAYGRGLDAHYEEDPAR